MILNNAVPKKSRLWLGVLLLLMIASLPSFALAVAESSSVTAPPPLKPTETLKTPASPLSPALQKSEGSAGTIGGEAVTPALVAASMAESGHSVMSPESLIAPAIPTGKPTTVEPSARVTPPVSASESVSIKVERFVISAAEAKRLRAPDGRTGHSTSPAGNLQLALPDPKVLESVRLAHGDRLTNSPMIITSINVPATVRYGMAGKGPEGYTDVTFTPTVINPDKSITMSIYVYASVQGAFVTGPDGKTLPTIHSIGITAMVRVQNGETFAIFYQNEDKTDNETMLLVTPSIITTPLSGPAHIGLGGGTSGRGTGNH